MGICFLIEAGTMVHEKDLGHPVHAISCWDNYFVTACDTTIVQMWDFRKLVKPVQAMKTEDVFSSVTSLYLHGQSLILGDISKEGNYALIEVRSTHSGQKAVHLTTKDRGPPVCLEISGQTLISTHKNTVHSWNFARPEKPVLKKGPPLSFFV